MVGFFILKCFCIFEIMDPKSAKHNNYSTWIESEYPFAEFSRKDWDSIYRGFRGFTNKSIHMVVDDLTCEYSGLPSVRFYDDN